MIVDWETLTKTKGKLRKPKFSEAELDLQHAVVRGDQKEIERLRYIVATEKDC